MKFQNVITDVNQYPRYDDFDYFLNKATQNTKELVEISKFCV